MNGYRRRLALGLTLITVACSWVGAPSPAAATSRAHPMPARIRRGQATFDFPAVGALSAGSQFCTAILIGCETVLTAAHCVCPDDGPTYETCIQRGVADPARAGLFFQNYGFVVGVRSIAVDPEYVSFQAGDVAVIKLHQPLSGIAPLSFNGPSRPPVGMAATIVGFGRTEGMEMFQGLGIKRTASVSVSDCPPDLSDRFDCYAAESDAQPSACPGDSGGPLLVDFGNGPIVAGTTTGARGGPGVTNCETPLDAVYTDTFLHRSFIQEQLNPDTSDGSCGALPAVGERGATVQTLLGEVDGRRTQLRDSIDVPAGTTLLRVTMNGELATNADPNNFDLFIKAGAPPSPADFDCADTRNSSYGACEVGAPPSGKWYVLVQQVAGGGTVQLTATLFESLPATPTVTYTPTRGPTSTPRPPAEECVGDCDGDGHISIAELVRGVALALGNPAAPCPDFDPEGDGVGIAALVKAVNGALYGCLAP